MRLNNEQGNKVFYDDPKVIEAVQNWYDLSKVDGSHPPGIISWGATPRDFLEGKAAMIGTPRQLTNIRQNAKFEFGVTWLPGMRQTERRSTGGGNFYVFKGTTPAKQEAAFKFIKFMTEPEIAADWSVKTGYVATSEAAYARRR